jgi:hypothetical protein
MSYEKRDFEGALGKNNNRTKDTHPEYSGACTIGGVGYWISAWIKTNRDSGEKFFSLAFKVKQPLAVGLSKSAPPADKEVGPPLDDDVPF